MAHSQSPEGKFLGGCSEKREGAGIGGTRGYRTLDPTLKSAGQTNPLPWPAVDVDVDVDVETVNPPAQSFCNPWLEKE